MNKSSGHIFQKFSSNCFTRSIIRSASTIVEHRQRTLKFVLKRKNTMGFKQYILVRLGTYLKQSDKIHTVLHLK